MVVRVRGVEPPRLAALEPKSSASASSATPARSRTPGAELARVLAQLPLPVKASLKRDHLVCPAKSAAYVVTGLMRAGRYLHKIGAICLFSNQ